MKFQSLKSKNIIFLDFDGVLNCIHEEFDTKIILSTSWKNAYIFTDLIQLLHDKGIHAPVIDKTPTYVGPTSNKSCKITDISKQEFNENIDLMTGRNREILTYVRIHDIQHYVILDDYQMTHPELIPHQVLTSYFDVKHGGLLDIHIPQIRKILSTK